ncbi:MAG: ComF family protein [Arenicellales bacterium]
MDSLIKQLSKYITHLIPCRCLICEQNSARLICTACQAALHKKDSIAIKNSCVQCGEKLQTNLYHSSIRPKVCGRCISQPPAFDQTFFAYVYQSPIADLILRFKYKEQLMLSQLLAEKIALKLLSMPKSSRPTLLIPIPLHPQRLKERGFNQALELAKHIGKRANIPVYKRHLVRVKQTKTQKQSKRRARALNMKGAFTLVQTFDLESQHIAIIDDVITTGSTMSEAAKTLRKAQPEQITLLAIAKRH